MLVIFWCRKCDKKLWAESNIAGRKTKCPQCQCKQAIPTLQQCELEFRCACGQLLRIPAKYLGKRFSCPRCKQAIVNTADPAVEILAFPVEEPQSVPCPHCASPIIYQSDYADHECMCPYCHNLFRMPAPGKVGPSVRTPMPAPNSHLSQT